MKRTLLLVVLLVIVPPMLYTIYLIASSLIMDPEAPEACEAGIAADSAGDRLLAIEKFISASNSKIPRNQLTWVSYCSLFARSFDEEIPFPVWLGPTAEQGHIPSMELLAAYYSAAGISNDLEQAENWARKSMELGSADGMYMYAKIWEKKAIESQDPSALKSAFELQRKAAKQGSLEAQKALRHIHADYRCPKPDSLKNIAQPNSQPNTDACS